MKNGPIISESFLLRLKHGLLHWNLICKIFSKRAHSNLFFAQVLPLSHWTPSNLYIANCPKLCCRIPLQFPFYHFSVELFASLLSRKIYCVCYCSVSQINLNVEKQTCQSLWKWRKSSYERRKRFRCAKQSCKSGRAFRIRFGPGLGLRLTKCQA